MFEGHTVTEPQSCRRGGNLTEEGVKSMAGGYIRRKGGRYQMILILALVKKIMLTNCFSQDKCYFNINATLQPVGGL